MGNGSVPGQSHRPGQGETADGGEEDAGREETKVMCVLGVGESGVEIAHVDMDSL